MGQMNQQNEREIYEQESTKLEREFFDRMRAGETLEQLKPILLKLKQVKLHLNNLGNERDMNSLPSF